MKRRERILGMAMGTVLVLFASRWAWGSYIRGPLEALDKKRLDAEKKLAATNQQLVAARLAKQEVEELSKASLPSNPTLAQEQYQSYLINLLHGAQIANSTIAPSQPAERDGVLFMPVSIQADTTIEAFTRFLHSFYSTRRLQQIRRLSLNPIEQADMAPGIRISLSIEALAFADGDAPEGDAQLEPRVANDPKAYDAVVQRNVLYARGPGGSAAAGNSPEFVVLTSIVHDRNQAEADVYDRALNTTRRVKVGDTLRVGTVTAKVIDLGFRDAVLDCDGELTEWRLGASLSERKPLSLEAALDREVRKSRMAGAHAGK